MLPIPWPTLLIHPECPLCHQAWSGHSFCPSCLDQLELNRPKPRGSQPIPWTALGHYDTRWRQLILGLRQHPRPKLIRALASECVALLPRPISRLQLCAIPPRQGHRPGPPQWIQREIKRQCGISTPALLKRRRACIAQHHLNGWQRQQNLRGVFTAEPRQQAPAQVILMDDVLTSGATSQAAAEALKAAGHGVVGVLCLAYCHSSVDAPMA